MNTKDIVAVCSRSFSNNLELRLQLQLEFQKIKFNDSGKTLRDGNLFDFLNGATMAIVGLESISNELLKKLPHLKVISKYGVGLDSLDFHALRNNNIRLGWTPGVNKTAVAELVISYSILMLRGAYKSNKDLINGYWLQTPGYQLTNKTFGIIGCGNVGKEVVRLLQPFNCKILCCDTTNLETYCKTNSLTQTNLKNLLKLSDVVTVHTPLNDSTKNLISKDELSLMKETAVLINLARGGIVNETDLEEALVNKGILASASDVFAMEPPINNPLLKLDNFFSTPHIGGSAKEAIMSMGLAAIYGLKNPLAPDEYKHLIN